MPHPCALNEKLEGCAELAARHAVQTVEATGTSLKEALVANAPAISERLNNAMLKMGEWVEATEAFAAEQTPFLVKEIVWWGVADAGYWVAFGFLFCLIALIYGTASYRRWDAIQNMEGDSGMFMHFLAFAIPIVFGLFGILMVMANVMDMLKPIVAPRLYLIEFFRGLVS